MFDPTGQLEGTRGPNEISSGGPLDMGRSLDFSV
jgi:hypothetical protein